MKEINDSVVFIKDPNSSKSNNGFSMEFDGEFLIAKKAQKEGVYETQVFVFKKNTIEQLQKQALELYKQENNKKSKTSDSLPHF